MWRWCCSGDVVMWFGDVVVEVVVVCKVVFATIEPITPREAI